MPSRGCGSNLCHPVSSWSRLPYALAHYIRSHSSSHTKRITEICCGRPTERWIVYSTTTRSCPRCQEGLKWDSLVNMISPIVLFLIFGIGKCQHVTGVPPPTPSTSVPAAVSKSDKTSDPRLRKKRRINCASGAAKNKLANENPTTDASTTHASSTATDPPSASSWTRNAMQLPKTNAADLKFLKFNKASQISKSPLVPALVTSSNVNAQTELDQQPMRPLDLARKSPQERATLRKAK